MALISEFLAGSRSQLTLLHRPWAHNIFNTSYIPQIPHYQKSKTHPTFSQQLESSDVSKPYSFLCFAHLVLPDQLNIRESGWISGSIIKPQMCPKKAADDKEKKQSLSTQDRVSLNCIKMFWVMYFVPTTKEETFLGENGLGIKNSQNAPDKNSSAPNTTPNPLTHRVLRFLPYIIYNLNTTGDGPGH